MSSSTTAKQWIDAAAESELADWQMLAVTAGGRGIALFSVDGCVHATDNQCSHGDGLLCDGFLEGHEIECPLHQGRFDVRTGQATCEPARAPLRTYATRVENGRVWVALP